jgi:GT2 family glycosyltransferase
VEEAMASKSSHLLFLDSDMLVHGDVIQKLASHNKMVVGALYNERRMPPTSTVKFRENGVTIAKSGDDIPKQLFKCFAVATGCMLIDMRVFEKLEEPWFFYSCHEDGRMDYGEDVWFCDRVQKAGFDVWCDPTIDIRHIGDFPY